MSNRCCAKLRRGSKELCKLKQTRLQPTILRRKRKAECDLDESMDKLSVTSASTSFSEDDIASDSYCEDAPTTPTDPLSAGEYRFRGLTCMSTPETSCWRFSPLPSFSWADGKEVWELMVQKEKVYHRDPRLMHRHPALSARMRSILLEWLMEVCEVYLLQRSTYYLAQDFIDRYLATQTNVPKQQLQLLGITSLFVAAKTEEIYPPKVNDFAYVTDEACTENEILEKELVILKVLGWNLTPMTVNSWLNVYLQLLSNPKLKGNSRENFIFPDYSRNIFFQVSQITDLCMLDVKSLQFPYSVIAASALYYVTSREASLSVSGFEWHHIVNCVHWIAPYAESLIENGFAEMKSFRQIRPDDMHSIQTHSVDLQMLEKAQSHQTKTELYKSPPTSPSLLTPPHSTEKFAKFHVQETP